MTVLDGLSGYELKLSRQGELSLYHGSGKGLAPILVVAAGEFSSRDSIKQLEHEYALRCVLDPDWAARPLELRAYDGRMTLVLEDPGGQPLDRLLGLSMEVTQFFRVAIPLAAALRRMHERGIIHKDIKPANILVDLSGGGVWLTGFGIASLLAREHQAPVPPELVAGTLPYMAPEQTGRMNRSIDSRTDLYSLGITLYQMLTGSLPFSASDPLEWVHCHIAKRPAPPDQRSINVPTQLAAIVMKLLAKTPEERYQTAAGVERDLQHCAVDWRGEQRIHGFPLAQHDTPSRLLISEKLYGREHEVDTLLAAFDRAVRGGAPELILVSGYSGVGKSSVVNELHKVLVQPRGLFASGKFDQYRRGIPYSTLVQAFQSLVRPLLGKSDTELAIWRSAFLEALEPNARLMTDLIPELTLIIGEPPPVPELEPQQAQGRFHLVFRRFIGVFARPEHPLALFLDDLQWLDPATLELLEDLLTKSDHQYLMLIGAYRDNEVDVHHPLARRLESIRQAGARVSEIRLLPLALDDVGRLVSEALRCEPKRAVLLAQIVHEKSAGNPFFVRQFIYELLEDGLLRFDHTAASWSWDLDRIRGKGYTDNVVDLVVSKINRLPAETQQAVQQLACFGDVAPIAMLSIVLNMSEDETHAAMWPAVRQEMIELREASYKFMHDRVLEAAYSLIPETSRTEVHLRMGRRLVAQLPSEKREDSIFEIVNQLNRGAALITEQQERDQLADFNLIAGRRAKAATAFTSALSYFNTGATLLAENGFERQHELAFALELNRAECEYLAGELNVAQRRLETLAGWTETLAELAAVAALRINLYTTLDQCERGIDVGLGYLRCIGIGWSPRPTDDEIEREFERMWGQIGNRSIEDIVNLPLMSDSEARATMDVLTTMLPPALFTNQNLLCLVIGRMANLSLEHGNCDGSCVAYVWIGLMLGPRFGKYQAAFRFGRLGLELMNKRRIDRFKARVYLDFTHVVNPWAEHMRGGPELARRAFDAASEMGDVTFSVYSCCNLISALLASGELLDEVRKEAERALDHARKMRFGFVVDIIRGQLQLIRTLCGLTRSIYSLNDAEFDEHKFEQRLEDDKLTVTICWYWVRKLQSRLFANDYASAAEAAAKVEQVLWTAPSHLEVAEYHFYGALARAKHCDAVPSEERQVLSAAVIAHHQQLATWAENCPENFDNRAALVGAEIARLEGRELDAERLYEQAIHSARENGFVHNEALANELASQFYAERGFEKIARLYLHDARYCYLRWGADGKVRQIDELYPQLGRKEVPGPTGTIATSVEHLDLGTVIKVSQAISGEIVFEKMLDTLMRTAIAQAGAERGLLVLSHGAEPKIAAEAKTSGETVAVELRDTPVTAVSVLPETVLHYVMRTRESVILDDATTQLSFARDPYIRQHQARSILCLPLINQGKLSGALYLENNLAPRVFAPARIAVLKLLASQAAMAIENARLYRDLALREAKIRRLVDANIVGIFVFDLGGEIVEANDAFLHIVEYDRDDLASGRLRWTDMTPPEWLHRGLPELRATGTVQPFEKEYVRKDGSRVPVLVGGTILDGGSEGVAFVLDLTERLRAEQALRDSEEAWRSSQAALAHANRVATMGQLTASIAHEVNQPITATVTNAITAQRWLRAQPPNIDEATAALERVVKEGKRASDVIGQIRALIRKAPPRKDLVAISDAIIEVIALTRAEATNSGVSVRTLVADDLPLVRGDRVQIQQVILNLVLNAIEAMRGVSEAERELLISAAKEQDDLLVEVRDSGPGLAPATMERLFEPFYTTKPTGLGLGLSICQSIVEASGGRLWAGVNVPRGAVFQFTIRNQSDAAA